MAARPMKPFTLLSPPCPVLVFLTSQPKRDGEAAGAEACRDSYEPSNSLSPATTTARWVYSGRTSGAGAARKVWERRFWLCVDPGDASPNTRVRSCRLTGWASDVDLRKVSGMERQQG